MQSGFTTRDAGFCKQMQVGCWCHSFIMESTRRLGASAVEFVSKFIVSHHLHTSLFLDHVAVGTARASGQMVNQARWNVERMQVE